jgi:hypothetical protein
MLEQLTEPNQASSGMYGGNGVQGMDVSRNQAPSMIEQQQHQVWSQTQAGTQQQEQFGAQANRWIPPAPGQLYSPPTAWQQPNLLQLNLQQPLMLSSQGVSEISTAAAFEPNAFGTAYPQQQYNLQHLDVGQHQGAGGQQFNLNQRMRDVDGPYFQSGGQQQRY